MRYGVMKVTLLSFCKVLGNFILKNSKSIACLLSDVENSYPGHMLVSWKTYTYATCFCIELCQTVVTLVRNSSCFHDQDHVHSTLICQLLHWKLRKNMPSIHPPNKNSMGILTSIPNYLWGRGMAMGKKGGWTCEGPRKKENIWAHEVPHRNCHAL